VTGSKVVETIVDSEHTKLCLAEPPKLSCWCRWRTHVALKVVEDSLNRRKKLAIVHSTVLLLPLVSFVRLGANYR
jgi:hypothetical protein